MTPSAVSAAVAPGVGPTGLAPDTQEFLKALGSPTRQRIMMLFSRDAELSVGKSPSAPASARRRRRSS
ncbi:hypothetical protein [Micromonospora sp. NPDC049204]|uniref:hypothetical protein n=1 Tax=Micromonospora sp. NPDC049204 TaxID=3154351 RepID=UPI0033D1B4A3